MRFTAALFAPLLLLAGCTQSTMTTKDPSNPYYTPPAGSKIQLNQPVTVPSGVTRIFLQRGQLVYNMKFDRYVPSCNFEVSTLSERAQTIEPETFLVVRVQQERAEVVQFGPSHIFAGMGSAGNDGHSMVAYTLHLWVGSDRQPNLRRLTCRGAFDDLYQAYPPSISEMRAALGDFAEIILP